MLKKEIISADFIQADIRLLLQVVTRSFRCARRPFPLDSNFSRHKNSMARTAFRKPAASVARLRVKSALAQSLHEVSILFDRPNSQNPFFLQSGMGCSDSPAIVESGVV